MNLWLRFLALVFSFFFRPRLKAPDGVAALDFRVLPTDIDLNLHMTNGRYPCFVDLTRLDFFVRTGMIQTAFRSDWRPMMLASKIRFRRELKPFRRFRVETRLRWWNEASIVFEHRFITRARDGSEILAASALERTCFYARKDKSFVPVADLLRAMKLGDPQPAPATPEILAFMQAEEEMRRAA